MEINNFPYQIVRVSFSNSRVHNLTHLTEAFIDKHATVYFRSLGCEAPFQQEVGLATHSFNEDRLDGANEILVVIQANFFLEINKCPEPFLFD